MKTNNNPFKQLFTGRKTLLQIPGNALKVWLAYWMHSGKEELAWLSEEALCGEVNLNRDTMRKWRHWLVENGWLELKGHRDPQSGEFAIPVYHIKEGTVAEDFSDGRSRNFPLRQPPKTSVAVQPKPSFPVPAETFGEEVDSKKQVDSGEVDSFSVFQSVSQGEQPEEKATPTELTSEEQNPNLEAPLNLNSEWIKSIARLLGLGAFKEKHRLLLRSIGATLRARDRNAFWLLSLLKWVRAKTDREAMFWNQKLTTGERALAKLDEFLKKGSIAEQYDVWSMAKSKVDKIGEVFLYSYKERG